MLTTTIAAFCFSYYFVNVVDFAGAIKRTWKLPPGKRIKPLDCVQCLSVWVAVALWFCPQVVSDFMAVCFGAGFISTKIK